MKQFRNLASKLKLTTDEVLPPHIAGELLDLNKPPPVWDVPEPLPPVGGAGLQAIVEEAKGDTCHQVLKSWIREGMAVRGETFMDEIPEDEWAKLDEQTEYAYSEIRKETGRKRRLLRKDSLMFIKKYEKALNNNTYDAMRYGVLIHDVCGRIFRVVHTLHHCYALVVPCTYCPWCNGDMQNLDVKLDPFEPKFPTKRNTE